MNKILFSSKKEEWETPQDLFNKLNEEFNFTIDVASNENNFKCKRHYTEKENGLMQNWDKEVVWCNPPYGRKIGEWVKKASESDAKVIMLLPARTDTIWFHKYIYNKAEIRFIKGRLKFGNSNNSAPFPSMIVIFKGEEINEAHKKENGELRERVKELEKENENEFKRGFFTKVAENKANTLKIESQVIPKSLIKEKIKELNKQEQKLQDSISDEEREEYSDANISFELMDIEIRRSVLQELLEKRK